MCAFSVVLFPIWTFPDVREFVECDINLSSFLTELALVYVIFICEFDVIVTLSSIVLSDRRAVQCTRCTAVLSWAAVVIAALRRFSVFLRPSVRERFHPVTRRHTAACPVCLSAAPSVGHRAHLSLFPRQRRQHWTSSSKRSATVQLLQRQCVSRGVSRLRQKLRSTVRTRFITLDSCVGWAVGISGELFWVLLMYVCMVTSEIRLAIVTL